MIKIVDIFYSYIFSINSRKLKEKNHDFTRSFMAQLVTTWAGISFLFFDIFFSKIFSYTMIIPMAIIGVIVYPAIYITSDKLYGNNGTRKRNLISVEKKQGFKEQNKLSKFLVLSLFTIFWMAFCVIMRFKFQKWFDL